MKYVEEIFKSKKPTARTVFTTLFVPDIAPTVGSKQVMFIHLSIVSSTSSGNYSKCFKPFSSGVYTDAWAEFSMTVSCSFSLWVFNSMSSHQGIWHRKTAVMIAVVVIWAKVPKWFKKKMATEEITVSTTESDMTIPRTNNPTETCTNRRIFVFLTSKIALVLILTANIESLNEP